MSDEPPPAATTGRRIGVAHFTTSLDMGGAQAMLGKLVADRAGTRTGAGARGGDVRHDIVSLLRPGSLSPPPEHAACHSLGMTRGRPDPLKLARLAGITRAIAPDLIQGWMYHGNLAASLARLTGRRSAPLLWNVRHSLADVSVESRRTRLLLALSARLSRGTDAIIYNSQVAARQHEAIGFAAERSVHIPNGFDCERYRPDPGRRAFTRRLFGVADGPLLVGMVARHHPMKDHAMLVRAAGRARAMGHDLHLLLVGTGLEPPPPALVEDIRAAGLPADRITLAGERLDVAEWLPGLDVLALPSAWGEAFPNVLGEAMACGVPCVATDVGDSGAILGAAGIIVPPRDAGAMAAALADLATAGEDARLHRGHAGRLRVLDTFEIGRVVDAYHRLYSSLLASGRSQMRAGYGPSALRGADTA